MSAPTASAASKAAEAGVEQVKPAQPKGPIPESTGPQPAAAGGPKAEIGKDIPTKATETLSSTTKTEAPSAPAAKAAAAEAPPSDMASAAAAKATAKPATATAKIATGDVAGGVEQEKKKPAQTVKGPDGEVVPKGGKAAALVTGGSSGAASKAKAAPTKAAALAKTAAPTSAAAVTGDTKTATASERLAATGSVLAKGVGALDDSAAPKAKSKAKASPSVVTVVTPSAAAVSAQSAPAPVAPPTVVDIVTGVPQPVLESNSNKPSTAGPAATGATPLGPARAYAKTATSTITSAVSQAKSAGVPASTVSSDATAKTATSAILAPPKAVTASAPKAGTTTTAPAVPKSVVIPGTGPAAVAVGRALEAGLKDPITIKGTKATVPISKRFQCVFVTSEVAPFSKTGGLGEAMDGLPVALAALGHRVMVVAPRYDQYKEAWDTSVTSQIKMAGKSEEVRFFHCFKSKVDYVFIDHPTFLERVDGLTGAKLYGPEWGKDFADNQARFAFFCKAALNVIQELPLGGFPYGDKCVVVANDWHSALVPMFIHADRKANPAKWKETKTTFLNHNSVFQGRFLWEEGLEKVFDIPKEYIDSITFTMPLKVGKYNKKVTCVNTMAAGLRYCDRALTVSPSYAKECCSDPEKGVELEELFALARVTGVLNGVKEGVSPVDKNFVAKTKMSCGTFTSETCVAAKEQLKATYRAENSLPTIDGPLVCFIGRLDAQKGYDLLLEAILEVIDEVEMQFIIVGAGRADLVEQTKAVEKKHPTKFYYAGWMGPERYALLAGCDYTLLPSRWEPCGLVQMEAMRFGTLPIVAPSGGLRDTVEDGVNGLWTDAEMTVEAELDEESISSIGRALKRAAEIHKTEPAKEGMMKRAAMAAAAEFTWSNAALQYEAIFEELGVTDIIPYCSEKSVTLEVDNQVC